MKTFFNQEKEKRSSENYLNEENGYRFPYETISVSKDKLMFNLVMNAFEYSNGEKSSLFREEELNFQFKPFFIEK